MLTQYHGIIAAYRSKTNSHLPAVLNYTILIYFWTLNQTVPVRVCPKILELFQIRTSILSVFTSEI